MICTMNAANVNNVFTNPVLKNLVITNYSPSSVAATSSAPATSTIPDEASIGIIYWDGTQNE